MNIRKYTNLFLFLFAYILVGCGHGHTETLYVETDPTALFYVECFDDMGTMVYGPAFIITAVKGKWGTWDLQGTNGNWTTVWGNCVVE